MIFWNAPVFSWLFLAAPLLIWMGWRLFCFRKNALASYSIASAPSKLLFFVKEAMLAAVWIAATIALMQPLANPTYLQQEASVEQSSIVIALDASASMQVQDTRTGKSRFEVAKEIADEILKNSSQKTAALWAFTAEPAIVSPMTLDLLFVRLALREVVINEGDIAGTLFDPLFDKMRAVFEKKAPPVVILLTDGEQTSKSPRISEFPFKVLAIGMGSKEGGKIAGFAKTSRLNEPFLKEIARVTRGRYFDGDLGALAIAEQVERFLEGEKVAVVASKDALSYTPLFQIPLAFATICILLYFFLANTRRTVLFSLFIPLVFTEYQAKNYEAAAQEIREFLTGVKTPWQRQVLEYNLATVYLQKGELERAAEELISLKTSLEWLKEREKINLSLARLRQAGQENEPLAKLSYLRSGLETADGEDPHSKNISNALKMSIASLEVDPKTQSELLDFAILQVPLQVSTLDQLDENEWTEKSLQYVKQGNEPMAKLYLLQARHSLEKGAAGSDAQKVLEALIKEQEHALLVNRFSKNLQNPPSFVENAQQQVVKEAALFLPAVVETQKKQFAKDYQKENWKEVIALFSEGKEAAGRAQKSGIADQQKAISKWRLALQALLHPSLAKQPIKSENEKSIRDLVRMSQEDLKEESRQVIQVPEVDPW